MKPKSANQFRQLTHDFDREVFTLSAAVGVTVLVVYVFTMLPGVGGGDSGELVTASYLGAVAHPPGYPLYLLLAKLFTFIPYGTIAWRVALFSAVCDSVAAFFLSRSVGEATNNRWAGMVAGGLFAFSPLVWTYATVAEVFALNNLFVSALLFLLVRFERERSVRVAMGGALLSGLGLANHQAFILYVFPAAVWVLWRGRRSLLRGKALFTLGALFMLGLLPYAYLPWAAGRLSPVSWGDVATWTGFFNHITRSEYGTLKLVSTMGTAKVFGEATLGYLGSLPKETLYLGVPFVVFALVSAVQERGLWLATVWGLLFYLLVFEWLGNLRLNVPVNRVVFSRFWQQPNILVFAWIGLGIAWVARRESFKKYGPIVAILIVSLQCGINFRTQDQHDNRMLEKYGLAILEPLPKNALYLTKGDADSYVLKYLQYCEGNRPDVVLLDRSMLTHSWMKNNIEKNFPTVVVPGSALNVGYDLKAFIDSNIDHFPIYSDPMIPDEEDMKSWTDSYETIPFGFSERWVRKGTVLTSRESLEQRKKDLIETERWFRPAEWFRYRHGGWEAFVFDRVWYDRALVASQLIQFSLSTPTQDFKLLSEAVSVLSPMESLDERSEAAPSNYKWLAIAYGGLAHQDTAFTPKAVNAFRRYASVAPSDDTEMTAIRQMLESYAKDSKNFVMPRIQLDH